jgi:hypothetical protein
MRIVGVGLLNETNTLGILRPSNIFPYPPDGAYDNGIIDSEMVVAGNIDFGAFWRPA